MQINEVIRKYRKQNNMTQEEMANRLGVSAPAVNKWESGASMPDVALLAPIARLLHISLDELLSFKDELSETEVSNIITEIMGMFEKEPFDTVYRKMVEVVREYPSSESLILALAVTLYAKTLMLAPKDRSKYEGWIRDCYEKLLTSDNEDIKLRAADGLYALFIGKEDYDEAEKCLEYYSAQNPEKKRKLATIYSRSGKYEEAYKTLEEIMFADYQKMSVLLHEISTVAIKTENYEKARNVLEKESALAEVFEMGEYYKNAGRLDYAVAVKDADMALEIMDTLLSHTGSLMDYTKSKLYEHMTFTPVNSAFTENMINNQLKYYTESEDLEFVRKAPGWVAFKEKWT
ncbi:MAG: helix-turn-helix transcriptional regulator [Lachnospiraceae bacterium]|nr:helix-turn-helix transcriptional regulator [Lachnospiraceae bacterium]